MVYALRESLKLVCEEGLVETWARHRANAGMGQANLAMMHAWNGIGLEVNLVSNFAQCELVVNIVNCQVIKASTAQRCCGPGWRRWASSCTFPLRTAFRA